MPQRSAPAAMFSEDAESKAKSKLIDYNSIDPTTYRQTETVGVGLIACS